MYGVSRTTARNALAELKNLGYVDRVPGSGSFVRKHSGAIPEPEASGTVAFLVCRHHYPTRNIQEDYFYFEVMEGIQSELTSRRSHLLFQYVENEDDGSLLADLLVKVNGVLLAEAHSDRLIASILSADVPIVLINPSTSHLKFDVSSVSVDNRAGSYRAVRHLIEIGHRVIAYIQGPKDSNPALDRYDGYITAMREADIALESEYTTQVDDWTMEQAEEATRMLLERVPQITAIACANDTIAIGALAAVRSLPSRGHEISVVGFDDISLAAHSNPPLTTVRSPMFELGQVACRLLPQSGAPARLPTTSMLLLPSLKLRESTKPR